MKIKKEILEEVPVFSPGGRLDASSSGRFKTRMAEEILPGGKLLIDLTGLEFLDSSGIGALISIHRKSTASGGEVKLVCLNDRIRQVLALTRADRLFDIYDDPQAGARSFRRGQT